MNMQEEYTKCLKANGIKVTTCRKAVMDTLAKSEVPISAEDIYMKLKETDTDINLSTVYRNLELLAMKNIVTKINFIDNAHMLYEYNSNEHKHYLICTDCRKIFCVKGCPIKDYVHEVEENTGFKVTGHSLYMYGICKSCAKHKI